MQRITVVPFFRRSMSVLMMMVNLVVVLVYQYYQLSRRLVSLMSAPWSLGGLVV